MLLEKNKLAKAKFAEILERNLQPRPEAYHYAEAVVCDFCGQYTRGKIYKKWSLHELALRTTVDCDSCFTELFQKGIEYHEESPDHPRASRHRQNNQAAGDS